MLEKGGQLGLVRLVCLRQPKRHRQRRASPDYDFTSLSFRSKTCKIEMSSVTFLCGHICCLLFSEKHMTGVERRRCQIVLGQSCLSLLTIGNGLELAPFCCIPS